MAYLGNAKVVMLGGSGGGGGTTNYNQLTNKPSINGVTLQGNKTTADLSIPVVEGNPTGVSAISPLKVLRITNGETSAAWKIDPVVANPSDTASTDLTKIKIGNTAYNIPSEPYLEQSVTLSTSQTTTVTFTDARILTTSVIDPAISVWGIFPEDVTVTSGSCTIVMPQVSTAQTVTVGIFIKR